MMMMMMIVSCTQVDDAEEYSRTRRAMDIVCVTAEEQSAAMGVVAAVLHLGNVSFRHCDDAGGAALRDADASSALDDAAAVLSVDRDRLERALTSRDITTREGVITKRLDAAAAVSARDALAKTLYVSLFDWLVARINASIGQDAARVSFIGVLDIYGFETFTVNSFEQFCINLANEKLQQHFNQHVFKMEQEVRCVFFYLIHHRFACIFFRFHLTRRRRRRRCAGVRARGYRLVVH